MAKKKSEKNRKHWLDELSSGWKDLSEDEQRDIDEVTTTFLKEKNTQHQVCHHAIKKAMELMSEYSVDMSVVLIHQLIAAKSVMLEYNELEGKEKLDALMAIGDRIFKRVEKKIIAEIKLTKAKDRIQVEEIGDGHFLIAINPKLVKDEQEAMELIELVFTVDDIDEEEKDRIRKSIMENLKAQYERKKDSLDLGVYR